MIGAILAGLFLMAAPARSAEKIRELGGIQTGCPMRLIYEPDVFRAGGAVPVFVAAEIEDRSEMESLAHQGTVEDPASGREWHLLSSLGMSCDPYFLFLSSGPTGKQRAEFSGETLRLTSPKGFSIRGEFNLFFPIEKRYAWKDGRPSELQPEFYKVQRKTKALIAMPLYPAPKAGRSARSISAGMAVTVSGYLPSAGPDGRQERALVKAAAGGVGWIEVKDGVLEGVSFHGD